MKTNKTYKDITGQIFNKLTVIKFTGKTDPYGQRLWECLCRCGKKKEIIYSNIVNNISKSCGRCKKYGEIPGYIFSSIIRNAKIRKLKYNLSKQFLWNLFLKQNRKCALSGIDISFTKSSLEEARKNTSASLDRINSAKGYTEDNVRWIHKDINKMKSNYSDEYFLYICQRIVSDKKDNKIILNSEIENISYTRKGTKKYSAFNESKSIREWSLDNRCKCSYRTLRTRLVNKNMNPEEALTKSPEWATNKNGQWRGKQKYTNGYDK